MVPGSTPESTSEPDVRVASWDGLPVVVVAEVAWRDAHGRAQRLAQEWALVLASQEISSRIRVRGSAIGLEVDAEQRDAAVATLYAYLCENPASAEPARHAGADADPSSAATSSIATTSVGLVFGVSIVVIHAVTGGWSHSESLFDRASANAVAILGGEWWRCVTALCLHADWRHVLGNTLVGVYGVATVCRVWGVGVGFALFLASGALGNAINALAHQSGHDSVGASTAVFGAIGLLAGSAARRQQPTLHGRRRWLPFAAGLGLLAMLGTSGVRVDLWAHLFGFVAGSAIGAAWPRPVAGLGAQLLLAVTAVGGLLYCWGLALR